MATKIACGKCVRLWREYAAATREHVGLVQEQEKAAGNDLARFTELEPEIETAAERRDAARANIKSHLSENHGEQLRVMTYHAGE